MSDFDDIKSIMNDEKIEIKTEKNDKIKKLSLKKILKIKWYKFSKHYQKQIVQIIILFIIGWIYMLLTSKEFKPIQDVIYPLLYQVVFWVIIVVAVICFIYFCSVIYEYEKINELKYIQKNKKVNLKKGFNRINIILVSLCSIMFFFCIGTWQFEQFNHFDKENTKFYDIKTHTEIYLDICDYFPLKKISGNYYHIESLTPDICMCKSYNDIFILEHKKDLYIKMPNKTKKLSKLCKCLTILIFLTFLFYSILRGIYFLFIKFIDWLVKGFKND